MSEKPSTHPFLRTYQSSDADPLARIRQQCAKEAGIGEVSTLGLPPTAAELHLRASTAEPNSFMIAELPGINDNPVGYSSFTSWEESSGITVFLIDGYVASEARGRGVGTVLLQTAEQQIAALAVQFGVASDAVFGTGASSCEKDRIEFLHNNGYSSVFSMIEMEKVDLTNICPPVTAASLRISDALPNETGLIWQLNEELYANRPFTTPASSSAYENFMKRSGDNFALWKVMRDGDNIAGFVISKKHTDYAEITDVSVMPAYRRKGIAKALLTHNLAELQRDGVSRVRLQTNGENTHGARSLYEQLGFELKETRIRFRKAIGTTQRLC